MSLVDFLLAGYLGGLTFALLMAAFTLRSGGSVPYRQVLWSLLLWPLVLPLFVLFPLLHKGRFRA